MSRPSGTTPDRSDLSDLALAALREPTPKGIVLLPCIDANYSWLVTDLQPYRGDRKESRRRVRPGAMQEPAFPEHHLVIHTRILYVHARAT